MAKKKITPNDTSAPPAAPVKRRAPAKKKPDVANDAASPVAVASVASTEPHGNGKAQPSQAEIAEAAYFRHLKRGGAQGDEFNDWVEAERELRARQSR
jgi:hypothetical protein